MCIHRRRKTEQKEQSLKKSPQILLYQDHLTTKHLTHFADSTKINRVLSQISVRTGQHATQTRQQMWQQLSPPLQADLSRTGLCSLQAVTNIHLSVTWPRTLQGWVTHSFSGQHVPVPQHPHSFKLSFLCPLLKDFKLQNNDPNPKEKKKIITSSRKKKSQFDVKADYP